MKVLLLTCNPQVLKTMKRNLKNIFLMIMVGTNQLNAQYHCNSDTEFNNFFFNLILDSSNTSIVEQIKEIEHYNFVSTDEVDTFWNADKSLHFTYNTPKNFLMSEFYAQNSTLDTFNSDSLFIFLGVGWGIQYGEPRVEFDIKTIEIIRNFENVEAAIETYVSIFQKINEKCQSNRPEPCTLDFENDFRKEFTIELDEQASINYLNKAIVLKYYLPRHEGDIYTVNLSYERSVKKLTE